MDRDNPLTARVFVNRLWKLYFGQGLSKSLEDLGSQGELPTHPELLDWLAVEFMDSGWDVKHLVKLIVMSGTYRQASVNSRNVNERDPFNRLLARQSRFRLDAEMVRDNALSLSGLLSEHVGGPSVKPYQPAGLLGRAELPAARVAERHRHRPLPPRPVHALAALVPAPEHGRLRRPEPGGMHRRTAALQHPAAGPGAAE